MQGPQNLKSIESSIVIQEDTGSVLDNLQGNIKHKQSVRRDKTVKRIQEVGQRIQRMKCPVLHSLHNF